MRPKVNPDNPFQVMKIYIPKSTFELLKKRSREVGTPMSRLVTVSVDNELDAPNPFYYACTKPTNTFIDGAYLEEASKIAVFLQSFPSGTGIDTLMLCRRDIGVPNKETFMLAYRELLEKEIIEEVAIPRSAKFKYPPGAKYTRLKNVDRSTLLLRKKKMLESVQGEIDEIVEGVNIIKKIYGIGEEK